MMDPPSMNVCVGQHGPHFVHSLLIFEIVICTSITSSQQPISPCNEHYTLKSREYVHIKSIHRSSIPSPTIPLIASSFLLLLSSVSFDNQSGWAPIGRFTTTLRTAELHAASIKLALPWPSLLQLPLCPLRLPLSENRWAWWMEDSGGGGAWSLLESDDLLDCRICVIVVIVVLS